MYPTSMIHPLAWKFQLAHNKDLLRNGDKQDTEPSKAGSVHITLIGWGLAHFKHLAWQRPREKQTWQGYLAQIPFGKLCREGLIDR